jgi:hypothetical protein
MKAPNTMSLFRTVLGTAGVATLFFAGCNPGTFVDLGDQAPVEAINRPDAFNRTGFGATVAAIEGLLANGEPSTRLAVGGGTDTGHLALRHLELRRHRHVPHLVVSL